MRLWTLIKNIRKYLSNTTSLYIYFHRGFIYHCETQDRIIYRNGSRRECCCILAAVLNRVHASKKKKKTQTLQEMLTLKNVYILKNIGSFCFIHKRNEKSFRKRRTCRKVFTLRGPNKVDCNNNYTTPIHFECHGSYGQMFESVKMQNANK